MPKYLVMNIGCIECGVSSNIVGIFNTEEKANEIAAACAAKYYWRDGGQNEFEVFVLPQLAEDQDYLNPEYEV